MNEPHSYSDVSRHGEIGKDVNLGSESMPDLSVCIVAFVSFIDH